MEENKEKLEVKSLNEVLYDVDLSIDELEERLEFETVWFCLVYKNEVHPPNVL
jgi:hypothetical protein